jgi:hypothetical protein
MKMLYAPPPLFGLWLVEPVIVDVIGVDNVRGMATVKMPVPGNAVINILRGPGDPIVTSAQREVILADLKPINLKPISDAAAEPDDGSPSSASSATTTTEDPRRPRR